MQYDIHEKGLRSTLRLHFDRTQCKRSGREIKVRSNGGFTLIELAVSIAITGLLLSGGLVAYRQFNQRQIVKNTASNIKNTIRNIQDKALQGEKPLSGCTVLEGYTISFSANQLQSYATCSNGNGSQTTINLPANVTISPIPSAITFKALGDGVINPGTIRIVGFDRVYELMVTVSGELQDNGYITP